MYSIFSKSRNVVKLFKYNDIFHEFFSVKNTNEALYLAFYVDNKFKGHELLINVVKREYKDMHFDIYNLIKYCCVYDLINIVMYYHEFMDYDYDIFKTICKYNSINIFSYINDKLHVNIKKIKLVKDVDKQHDNSIISYLQNNNAKYDDNILIKKCIKYNNINMFKLLYINYDEELLLHTIKYKRYEIMKYLFDNNTIDCNKRYLFEYCVLNSDYKCLQYLHDTINFNKNDIDIEIIKILYNKKQFEIISFIENNISHELVNNKDIYKHIIIMATEYNDINSVRRYCPLIDDINFNNNILLYTACINERIDMIKYYVSQYNLDVNNFRFNNNIVLLYAFLNSKFELIKYLFGEIKMTIDDLMDNNMCIFLHMLKNPNMKIIEYIVDELNISKKYFNIKSVRMMIYNQKRIKLRQYLIDKFNIVFPEQHENNIDHMDLY